MHNSTNKDGHFKFFRVVECHGSINFWQAVRGYKDIWPAPLDANFCVDKETLTTQDLPVGPPG